MNIFSSNKLLDEKIFMLVIIVKLVNFVSKIGTLLFCQHLFYNSV